MVNTAAEPDADSFVPPTHDQGFSLFKQVLDALELAGWTRRRIDTFTHPINASHGRAAMTVRHHFTAGVWELYYEPDRYWNPNGVPTHTRVARIRLDRPLPAPETVINELFGPAVGRYFPSEIERELMAPKISPKSKVKP